MIKRIQEIYTYKDMIKSLVKRELRGKYNGSFLGLLWNLLNPLAQIAVYLIVFSVIVRNDLENFSVYMISGIVPWFFFESSLRQAAGSIRYQGDMIKKIYFPREVLPIAMVFANLVNMLICFVLVFIVKGVLRMSIGVVALMYLPLIMLIQLIMVLGFSLLLSAVTVYLKDMEYIISVILMAWIYATPILYTMDIVPHALKWIFMINPMTHVVECYHSILYYGSLPNVINVGYALVSALAIFVIGELVFIKLDANFAEEL